MVVFYGAVQATIMTETNYGETVRVGLQYNLYSTQVVDQIQYIYIYSNSPMQMCHSYNIKVLIFANGLFRALCQILNCVNRNCV